MIYTIGDSFTYGDELVDPSKTAWPILVGNCFDRPVLNMGKKAVGNTYIVKRVVDVAFKDDAELVLIAWTHPNRMEFFDYDNNRPFNTWPGRQFRGATHSQLELTKILTHDQCPSSDVWAYRKWIRDIILTQNLLNTQNKKYLMMVTWHDWEPFNDVSDLWCNVDLAKFIGSPQGAIPTVDYETFCYWFSDAPQGPNHHPLELGHQRIAEKINEHIRHLGWLS